MSSNRQSLMLGILVGGIVGSVAALLLAPQEGSRTREMMKERARQARDRASEMAGRAKESAGGVRERGRGYVEQIRSQAKAAVEAGRSAAAERRAEIEAEVTEEQHKTSI